MTIPEYPITREEMYLDAIARGGGGGDITLTTLNVSANGTTNAPSGTAYNKVIAAVNPTLTTKTITANGSYAASSDNADGYSSVTVNVPTPTPTLIAKTVTANGTYAAADDSADGYSSVTVNAPTGAQLIASGTFEGNGDYAFEIPVGKKMPKTDFVFNIWVDGGTGITPSSSTNRAYVWAQIVVQKKFGEYDLSTDGLKNIITKLTYPTVNTSTGVTTERKPLPGQASAGGFTRWTTFAVELMPPTQVRRVASGFSVKLEKGGDYTVASGVTYNWELLYIGSDPTNDIVEVA